MKLLKGLFFAFAFMMAITVNVQAKSEIKVRVNDRTVAMDTNPYISGNHTLVPIRFVATVLNFDDISWSEAEKAVTIKDNGTEIHLQIDNDSAWVNGMETKLGTPARIKNNRTYIPVRFVAENMGAEVSWDGENRIVNIYKDGIINNIPYMEDEIFWLARIIHAEAQGEPYEGKLGVGNVVLNRVRAKSFPDTIYGVIFDRKNGVQFTPVSNGAIYNNPSNACYYASDQALKGNNAVGESLFFCNPVTSTNSWIIKNRPLFAVIGKHNFYL